MGKTRIPCSSPHLLSKTTDFRLDIDRCRIRRAVGTQDIVCDRRCEGQVPLPKVSIRESLDIAAVMHCPRGLCRGVDNSLYLYSVCLEFGSLFVLFLSFRSGKHKHPDASRWSNPRSSQGEMSSIYK